MVLDDLPCEVRTAFIADAVEQLEAISDEIEVEDLTEDDDIVIAYLVVSVGMSKRRLAGTGKPSDPRRSPQRRRSVSGRPT